MLILSHVLAVHLTPLFKYFSTTESTDRRLLHLSTYAPSAALAKPALRCVRELFIQRHGFPLPFGWQHRNFRDYFFSKIGAMFCLNIAGRHAHYFPLSVYGKKELHDHPSEEKIEERKRKAQLSLKR